MTTRNTLPHNWRELAAEANRLDISVMAAGSKMATIGRLAELDKEISDSIDFARKIVDAAKAENREPDAAEQQELDGLLNEETGKLPSLRAERKSVQKLIDLKKSAAAAFDEGREHRNPLDGPGDMPPAKAAEGTAPTLEFRNASTGEIVRSLGVNDRFGPAPRASWDSFENRPSPSLAEAINSHLTGSPIQGMNGDTLFTGTDGQGGYLTGSDMFGTIFDLVRPNSVAFQAGAQTLPMDNSELVLVQQLSDPTVHWTPELARVPSSSMTFGKITLRPKKLAAIVPISIEMIEDAQNATSLIQAALTQAMAVAIDQAILSGAGTDAEPLGIRNQAGVNTVAATDPIADYLDLESAIERIDARNYPGQPSDLAWIANPRDASQFNRLQANDLQPLTPTPGAAALRRFKTTSLPVTLGNGEDESEMIVGDMSQVVVGMRTGATVRFLPAGSVADAGGNTINAADQFATLVVVHMRLDVAVIRPEWLTIVNGVKWS